MAGIDSFVNMGHVPLADKLQARGEPMAATRGPHTTDKTLANFPTVEGFNQGEERYIAFWRSWWSQRKQATSQK